MIKYKAKKQRGKRGAIYMIISAAVKIITISNDNKVIITGLRHCDCYNTLANLGLKQMKDYFIVDDGFIDHQGNFLDRRDAWKHARNCGQLPVNIIEHNISEELFSEDLY